MIFVFMGLFHATLLAIAGYFILFAASKAEGVIALVGKALAMWVFFLAILAVVFGAGMPSSGNWSYGMPMMRGYGPGWMHNAPWPQPPANPQPAQPKP